jgi:hypothetical protein
MNFCGVGRADYPRPHPLGAAKKSGTVHFAPPKFIDSTELTQSALGRVPIFSCLLRSTAPSRARLCFGQAPLQDAKPRFQIESASRDFRGGDRMPDRPPDVVLPRPPVGRFLVLRLASFAARSRFNGSVGTQRLRMGRRRIERARGPWVTRQRGPVITFVEKSAGCLGFDQGIAALIWGLVVFSRGVSCCHYTRRVLMPSVSWLMLFILLCSGWAAGMLSGG